MDSVVDRTFIAFVPRRGVPGDVRLGVRGGVIAVRSRLARSSDS
jgi:hypothetical protein